MSKLARKLSRQIMAAVLSVAMIMPNMTVYANELSVPDTQEEITVDEEELDEAQPSLTEDEEGSDESVDAEDEAEASYSKEKVTSGYIMEEKADIAMAVIEDGKAAEGETVFQELSANADLDGYSGYTITNLTAMGDNHGIKASTDAKIELELATDKVADITVLGCCYSSGGYDGADITAYPSESLNDDESKLTVVKESVTGVSGDGNPTPKFTVLKAEGNVALNISNGAYIHSINIAYYDKASDGENPYKEKYLITVSDDGNGTGSADKAFAEANEDVVLTAKANDGYVFDQWVVESGSVTVEDNKFAMPASNVEIKATFKVGEDTNYIVAGTYDFASKDGTAGAAVAETGIETDITYHGSGHGLNAGNNSTMKLNLSGSAEITVWGCQHGVGTNGTVTPSSGKILAKEISTNGSETAPKHTLWVPDKGKVTLTFAGSGSTYVHSITVKYTTTEQFSITIKDDGNGSAEASSLFAPSGDEITLSATPNSGYRFKEWKVVKGTGIEISNDKFEMPSEDVEIQAVFEAAGASHNITVTTTVEHGTAEAGTQTTAVAEATVNMEDVAIATPAEGYELKEWQVTYKNTENADVKVDVTKNGSKYSFTMPDADITITPVFQVEVVKYFTTTNFYEKFTELGHTKGDAVEDIDGLTVVSGVKYNDSQHGLAVSNGGSMKLNLEPGTRYDLKVWGCREGGGKASITVKATVDGQEVELVKDTGTVPENSSETAPNYTLLNVEGEVTLTFSGGTEYVHSIIVTENSGITQYTVTVTDDGHGTAGADKALAPADTEITLTAEPDNHYQFKEWQVISGDVTIADNKFTMPASNVEIKAIFEPIIRRDWDFANDDALKGQNGTQLTGTTGTVAGLGIDASAENSGWDSTSEGTDGAEAKNKTKITVPVEGTCKIKVTADTANYTVDGTAAENAEQIFDCKGTDGEVVIEMTADNHVKAINVEPVYYVKEGVYNFPSISKTIIDGFSFNNIVQQGNSHGFQSSGANASMTLNLSGKANITVLLCRYGAVADNENIQMTATSGTVSVAKVDESGAMRPEFKVKEADAGELTLTFNNSGTLYFHSIAVEYVPEDVQEVYTDGIDVWDFGAEQLESNDTVKYNNMLTEEIINSWYPGIAPGTGGVTLKSFEVKDENGLVDFMFSDGGYTDTHRLRTTNTNLTRTDEKTLKVGDTTYTGYIYSNKSSDKGVYLGVRLNAGDVMTAVVSSNGNAYTISVENPDGSVQNFARPAGASIITYYATETGMHKIYNGTDEKLVVGRVTRQHSQRVAVSGNVTLPRGTTSDEFKLVFTCRESGMVREAAIEDAKYTVELFENYNYDVIVEPTTYVISKGAELTLGAADDTQTAEHDIVIQSVSRYKLSGSIKGLEDDAAAKAAINVRLVKPEGKLYQPVVTINDDMTYEAELEGGVEYEIVTEGINDYQIDDTVVNNSDVIKINADTRLRNITYVKKPVYAVTIEPVGATLADLAEAKFTFTNLNEKGYAYTFTGTENIVLRDGTYTVAVSDSGVYKPKLITNLVINGSAVTKRIEFESPVVTKWDFTDKNNYVADDVESVNTNSAVKNPCDGLSYASVEDAGGTWKYHGADYGSSLKNVVISVPVSGAGKVAVDVGYTWDIASGDISDSAASNSGTKTIEIPYTSSVSTVDITVGGSTTTYIKTIEVFESSEYKATITVGADKDYTTINDALDAVTRMERTDGQTVTIMIDPGNYEEMLVIKTGNIKLVNAAGENASIGLKNKGVDIDANAVRITSYYGHGYSYYSMGNDCKWNEEVLAVNKANGYESYTNPGSGTTNGSYWNATVVIDASNVSAEGIIFENSFNQYISKKAAEDVIVKQSGAKEGSVPRASMAYGDTTVQNKAYVERAAALAITNNQSKVSFDNCKFIGRQDTLYGGTGVTAAFYGCSVYGGTDYIMGGMKAVFAKCDLVFNTSEDKNDVGYITAAQQSSGHGYLMYNCHVTSTTPGVDTASEYTSKPGYLGRPWEGKTGEAVFYKTIVDRVDEHWSTEAASLIEPIGWNSTLGGESGLCQEYDTYEVAGVDNSADRAAWAKVLENETLEGGDALSVGTFLGDWDAFAGKNMTVVMPEDEDAPAAPKAIVTPEPVGDTVVEGAEIVLSAEMGAKIYYSVNSDAELTADNGTLYTKAIKVEDTTDHTFTVKAIAVKYGKTSTPAATFTYTVTEAAAPEKPVISVVPAAVDGNVKIGSRLVMTSESGADIYYNVNSEDAVDITKDKKYSEGKAGVVITRDMVAADSTITVKAITSQYGKSSEVETFTAEVIVDAPTANYRNGFQFPGEGGIVKLNSEEGTVIYYTISDSAEPADPTLEASNPIPYDKTGEGIKITKDTQIKAVAKRGGKYSEITKLTYLVNLNMPQATPESGTKFTKQGGKVTLKADDGANIYYTMGENPTNPIEDIENRKDYSELTDGIAVSGNVTINAVAEKDGRYSAVASFVYSVTVSFEEKPALTSTGNLNAPKKDDVITLSYKLDTDGTDASSIMWYRVSDTYEKPLNVTGKEYTITDEDAGCYIEVEVTPNVEGGTAGIPETAKTGTVKGGNKPPVIDEDGLVIEFTDTDTYPYTGAAIKPAIEVRNNGKVLVPGTDYTVKYTNNVKVSEGAADNKKPTVTVTGKGSLTGTTKENFTITKKDIADEDVIKGRMVIVKDKKVSMPAVYYGGIKLTAKDFEYDKNTTYSAAGEYELTITAKSTGNFSGSTLVPVKVVEDSKALKDAVKKFNVAVDKTKAKDLVYTGESLEDAIEACIKVNAKDSAKTDLTANAAENYIIVLPKDVTNAGTVKFTVVGIGDYSGCNVSKNCKILPKTIKSEDVVIDTDGSKSGEAGKVKVSGADSSIAFTSTGAKFELSLTYGEDELEMKEGVDYKVSYSSNKKAAEGKAKYTISFMGNYKGKYASEKFTISKAELSKDTVDSVVMLDKVCNGKDGVYKSTAYVTVGGVTLKNSEYEIQYFTDAERTTAMDKNNKLTLTDGKATVYVKIVPKAKGNYELPTGKDAAEGSYTVWTKGDKAKDLSKAKILFYNAGESKATTKIEYSGKPVVPAKIEVKIGKDTVATIDTSDETVFDAETQTFTCDKFSGAIVNNIEKGKATVVINATADGGYTGGKAGTFSVVSKIIKNFPFSKLDDLRNALRRFL